jgi:hypothetical protein
MDSMEFIQKYPDYIQTIRMVTKTEYYPVLELMERWNPHDLVRPESWFPDENSSLGYVYRLFIKEVRKTEKERRV